ncbi:MAG TPA: Ig-like domain repeat protein [Thermoanaerobaculia bacterium]|nr:Ig-like domain repeat protein [Thermoanaerobaculia bacterium]
MRILTAALALLVSLSAYAQASCPSLQWSVVDESTTREWVHWLESVDYDEDGELDLVGIADYPMTDALVWWKGAGDGTFGDATEIASATFLSNPIVAELTGDAHLDVAVVSSNTGNLMIYPGTGSGRGAAINNYFGNFPSRLFPVNMDTDSTSEIAVSYSWGFGVYDRVSGFFMQTAFEETPEDVFSGAIVSADFDGDTHFDIAITLSEPSDDGAGATDRVAVYFRNANGTYSAPVTISTPQPFDLTTADLDADGDRDLVVANWIEGTWDPSTIAVIRNTGNRTFSSTSLVTDIPGSLGDAVQVEVAEVTGDNHLDLIVTVVNGSWIATFPGLGNGTFRTPSFFDNGSHVGIVALADFTGDGTLDIAAGATTKIYSLTRACATQVQLYTEAPVITQGTDAILHASISGWRTGVTAPFGTVSLREGATELVNGVLSSSGTISFTLSGLSLGDHTLHAVFSGNSEIAGGTSVNVVQKVTTTQTSVTIGTPNAPKHGKPFSVSLAIENAGYDWVDVKIDGGTSFRKFTSTALSLTLAAGQHTIEARYPGGAFTPRSPWALLTFSVAKDTPSIAINGSLAAREGSAHELSVTVSTTGTLGAPTGNVHFYEDGTTTWLGTSALVNGTASFSRTFTRGSHAIRFVYAGDANFAGVSADARAEVLPNFAFALDARSLANGIQIYALPMQDTNTASLQLQRRVYGTSSWQNVAGFTGMTSGVDTSVARGVAYEYQMIGTITGGTPIVSNPDAAVFFTDDTLTAGTRIKRAHYDELATAVNLMRAQAGLPVFTFDAHYTTPGLIRASHLTSLRTALTEARTALGMTTPAMSSVTAGAAVQLVHMTDTRDLAR